MSSAVGIGWQTPSGHPTDMLMKLIDQILKGNLRLEVRRVI